MLKLALVELKKDEAVSKCVAHSTTNGVSVKQSWIFLGALFLAGCASQSGHMQVGTQQVYSSIREQREATQTVKVFEQMPNGYTVLGPVDASRCHRNTLDAAPTDDMVITDMKVAAYARGADGLTNIKVERESGLLKNCWYIITARATMLQKAKE